MSWKPQATKQGLEMRAQLNAAIHSFFQQLWKYAAPESKNAKWDTSNEYMGREICYLMQNWSYNYNVNILIKSGKTELCFLAQ